MKNPVNKLMLLVFGILLVASTVLLTLLIKKSDTTGTGSGFQPTPRPPKVEINPDGTVISNPEATSPQKSAGPLSEIKSGETRTKEEIKEAKIETQKPKPVDNRRLQVTYEMGKTYVSIVKASVATKSSYKDWGIETAMTFNYVAEFQMSRHIISNDGKRLAMDLQIDRSCSVSIFTNVENIKVDLGGVFQSALEAGGVMAGLPPGYCEVGKEALNKILNQKWLKNYCSEIITDKAAKSFAFVDSIQGKKAKIVFENGEGVVSITAIDCTLNSDQQMFLEGISLCSDITMMENLECKPGATWNVEGKDFLTVIDPSLKSKVNGSVTMVRKQDLGNAEAPEALLEIVAGVLTFEDQCRTAGQDVYSRGSWAPKGHVVFNFGQKIVTEAELSGAVELVEKSTNHILFEMKSVSKPVYEVQYSSWILEGDQLNETPKLTRPVKEGTLDALRARIRN